MNQYTTEVSKVTIFTKRLRGFDPITSTEWDGFEIPFVISLIH